MYGFGKELTVENIFKKISSYDIFKEYSENFKVIGKNFTSDLRDDDDNASSQINVIGGDLLYSDFGLGKSFRCIEYVKYKFGLDFFSALQKINQDFNLGLGINSGNIKNTKYVKKSQTIQLKEKKPSDIKKRKRPFTEKDLKYWNEFYWTEQMLKDSNTESISHYWINGNMWTVKPDELAFSYEYYWHNNRMQRKLYFPQRTDYKWFSNVDNTIVQLVNVMPKKGNVLFITSSKKDAGIFWRINIERYFPDLIIHGVAPNNEGSFVPEEWFNKQKLRWDKIILWYNNDWHKKDNPGVTNSIKYAEKYGIEWFVNPDNEPKDPSDYAKKYSLDKFVKLIKEKL